MRIKSVLRYCISCLLVAALLLAVTACNSGTYSPIKSSKRERTVIAELGDYDVKYELLRFLFMSQLDDFDGGDHTRWNGAEASALWRSATETLMLQISEFYATFDVCIAYGIDPEGDNIDEVVDNYVTADIDGGTVGGQIVLGYGSVDAYKSALAANYCTDAVRRLLYRYSACLASLYSYVAENGAEGSVTATDEALSAFLGGSDCSHFNRVFVPFNSRPGSDIYARQANAKGYIDTIRQKMVADGDDYAALIRDAFSKSYSSTSTLATDEEIEYGLWAGRYSTDSSYSELLYNTIFTIQPGEISQVIETADGYYIVYGMAKDEATVNTAMANSHLKETLQILYREELYNHRIEDRKNTLYAAVTYTKKFDELTPTAVMEGK